MKLIVKLKLQIMLTKKYDEALRFSSELHRTQNRKGTDIPYVSHLMSVSALVLEYGGNEVQAIAGLLHDAVEDQGGLKTLKIIRKKFGSKVAKIVSDCTDAEIEPKPPWLERKKSYIKSLKNKPQSSLFVSVCDKTHNASCIVNDHKRVGKKLWKRFSAKPKQIYWYYDSLGKCFNKNLKGKKVLKQNFSKLVLELKRISK